MNNDTTIEEYQRWVNTVNVCWESGWFHAYGWVFESPSGTKHDLSASDLSQLERIEKECISIIEG